MTETKKDGRHYLEDVNNVLNEVGPKLDEEKQAKIAELQARGEKIQKKLFLKTQGGTDLAAKAAETAETLRGQVNGGASDADVQKTFDELVESFEFFIHRAETLVIRMT